MKPSFKADIEFYAVWRAYRPDVLRFGCQREAEAGASSCKTPLSLDIFLNNLISQREFSNSAVPFCGQYDSDSDGSYGNSIRAMEEAR